MSKFVISITDSVVTAESVPTTQADIDQAALEATRRPAKQASQRRKQLEAGLDDAAGVAPRDKVLFKLLFRMLNDIRVLEGKNPITKAQFRDRLRAEL